jgi:putative ABC transport system permease protein
VSGDVAYRLDVSVGDDVTVASPYGDQATRIAGIFNAFGSSEAYQFHKLAEPTGALLRVADGKIDEAETSLATMGSVSSWVKKDEFKNGWLSLFKEYQGMTYAMDAITVVLALLLIGIFSFISTAERRWQFITLKLLGFYDNQIIKNSLVENFILTLLGIVLGIPLGMQMATFFNKSFQGLMSPPPTIFAVEPVAIRSLLIIAVTLLTVYAVAKLDIRSKVAEKIRRVFGTM